MPQTVYLVPGIGRCVYVPGTMYKRDDAPTLCSALHPGCPIRAFNLSRFQTFVQPPPSRVAQLYGISASVTRCMCSLSLLTCAERQPDACTHQHQCARDGWPCMPAGLLRWPRAGRDGGMGQVARRRACASSGYVLPMCCPLTCSQRERIEWPWTLGLVKAPDGLRDHTPSESRSVDCHPARYMMPFSPRSLTRYALQANLRCHGYEHV